MRKKRTHKKEQETRPTHSNTQGSYRKKKLETIFTRQQLEISGKAPENINEKQDIVEDVNTAGQFVQI